MPTSQSNEAIPQLPAPEPTDGQLLEGFVRRRDGAALAALVHRHAAMVWGVCRRLLDNYHDAEDAFQATFLVLVRRADAILPRAIVANWLYGVAHQTALKARATAAKRKGRERQVVQMPEPTTADDGHWCDLRPVLDQELSRLPRKYRAVIVLCDLEGTTRHEAARQLGVPEGTVAGRLARARTMLAKRLARHGLATAGAALAVVLSQQAAAAPAPTAVVSNTIEVATAVAAGQGAAAGVISAPVAALTQGVLKTMLWNKLKVATAVVLAILVCVVGATVALLPLAAEQKKTPATDTKAAPDDKKTDKERLQGKWVAVSVERNGTRIDASDDPRIKTAMMIFDGDNVTVSPLMGDEPRPYSLDPDKKPKEMDVGDRVKPTVRILTIYELDGDKLKWHWVKDGTRPSDFDTTRSKGVVMVFEKKG